MFIWVWLTERQYLQLQTEQVLQVLSNFILNIVLVVVCWAVFETKHDWPKLTGAAEQNDLKSFSDLHPLKSTWIYMGAYWISWTM
jgi:hypothetical protein